ncbi:CDGSH iron-sulfur domain-containing protein [Cognatiyoonia sp.]
MAGNVELTTGTGHKIVQGKNIFLCRCGASNNKPFRDRSHKDIGFEDRAS